MEASLIRLGRMVLLVAVSLAGGAAIAADIYRWTDDNGVVHFGERPPPGGASRIELRQAPSQNGADATTMEERRQRQQRLLDAYSHERDRKRQQQAENDAAAARNQAQCDRLRRHWRSLSWGGPVYYGQEDGGRRYLSESERNAEKSAVQRTYGASCRGSID